MFLRNHFFENLFPALIMANNLAPYPDEFLRPQKARKCTSSFLLYDKISTFLVTCFILVILIQLDLTVLKMKNKFPKVLNKSARLKFNPLNFTSITSNQYPPLTGLSNCLDSTSCYEHCKNVSVTDNIHVIFCPPNFKNNQIWEGSLLLFHDGKIIVEFSGAN